MIHKCRLVNADAITEKVLTYFHWLPISSRLQYEIVMLTFISMKDLV